VPLIGREAIVFGVNLRSAIGRGLCELDYHEMLTLHEEMERTEFGARRLCSIMDSRCT
jgi:hypothetical protein